MIRFLLCFLCFDLGVWSAISCRDVWVARDNDRLFAALLIAICIAASLFFFGSTIVFGIG